MIDTSTPTTRQEWVEFFAEYNDKNLRILAIEAMEWSEFETREDLRDLANAAFHELERRRQVFHHSCPACLRTNVKCQHADKLPLPY